MGALLAAKEIAVVCGPGGVGKTTVAAAAAAMTAVHQGGKVLVLTVDPARRLATALGLALERNGVRECRQVLWRARLGGQGRAVGGDAGHQVELGPIGDPPRPGPCYRSTDPGQPAVPEHFWPLCAEPRHIAVERLYELHVEGAYDLIVVDTPPTRNAVDFLLAPDRMAEFFSSRLLRMLTVPYRSRLADLASRPFYHIADRVLGSQFLQDIAEFFILFQTLSEGFVACAGVVQRLLADRRTTFVVVSTLEAVPVREAETFMGLLPAKGFHLGGLGPQPRLTVISPVPGAERSGCPVVRRVSGAGRRHVR